MLRVFTGSVAVNHCFRRLASTSIERSVFTPGFEPKPPRVDIAVNLYQVIFSISFIEFPIRSLCGIFPSYSFPCPVSQRVSFRFRLANHSSYDRGFCGGAKRVLARAGSLS